MIETPRLRIRPLAAADAEELFAIWIDPVNERSVGAASVEQVRGWLTAGAPWGVWEKASGELVGDCGLFENEDGEWELAYGFRRDRWGRGYATEAATACVRHGFEVMKLPRIVADLHHEGAPEASRRILARLGFRESRRTEQKTVYELTPG